MERKKNKVRDNYFLIQIYSVIASFFFLFSIIFGCIGSGFDLLGYLSLTFMFLFMFIWVILSIHISINEILLRKKSNDIYFKRLVKIKQEYDKINSKLDEIKYHIEKSLDRNTNDLRYEIDKLQSKFQN